jgi:ATP-binding protein involved in chromosome partitioning
LIEIFITGVQMNKLTVQEIEKILLNVKYPGFSRDIVSFGVIKQIDVEDNRVIIGLKFTTKNDDTKSQIVNDIGHAIKEKFQKIEVIIRETDPDQRKGVSTKSGGDPWAGLAPIQGIKSIIAIASGKGGVGKSTVSTNLAIALSQQGLKTGLMDSDIYGPSIHIMMGVEERPLVNETQKIIPIDKFGIKLMSMGFLIDDDAPLIWRGPMVMKAVEQFLRDVVWGELDVLVIDLPPGTGDAQLTLVQKTPLSGAIIITTPQEVALVDARRGLKMFQKVGTPVLGIIENMSYFACPDCGKKTAIFGSEGGARSSRELNVTLLGQIPIEANITESGDSGKPVVVNHPEGETAKAFKEIAKKITAELTI